MESAGSHSHDGKPLTPEHGGPARLLAPRLYSPEATGFAGTVRTRAQVVNGYNNYADPWKEQGTQGRFSGIYEATS